MSSVCLSFDFDAMSLWLSTFGRTGPQAISRGEYGARVGVPRILDLLERFEAPATFFTPGHTARSYPDLVGAISASGHEVASHGDFHEVFEELTPAEQRVVLERSAALLQSMIGERPRGFRAPGGDISAVTIELLVELGYLYDSSLMADDFSPYRCRIGDTWTAESFSFGSESPLVELPISFVLEDFPYFEYSLSPSLPGVADPARVEAIWTAELDYMLDRLPGGVLVLCLHPECIGRGSRITMLERFMRHAAERGASFERMADVAARWSSELPAPVRDGGS